MLSLAGIPPFPGFVAKFLIFRNVMAAGLHAVCGARPGRRATSASTSTCASIQYLFMSPEAPVARRGTPHPLVLAAMVLCLMLVALAVAGPQHDLGAVGGAGVSTSRHSPDWTPMIVPLAFTCHSGSAARCRSRCAPRCPVACRVVASRHRVPLKVRSSRPRWSRTAGWTGRCSPDLQSAAQRVRVAGDVQAAARSGADELGRCGGGRGRRRERDAQGRGGGERGAQGRPGTSPRRRADCPCWWHNSSFEGAVGGCGACVTGHNGMSVTGNTCDASRSSWRRRKRPPGKPPGRPPPHAPGQVKVCSRERPEPKRTCNDRDPPTTVAPAADQAAPRSHTGAAWT